MNGQYIVEIILVVVLAILAYSLYLGVKRSAIVEIILAVVAIVVIVLLLTGQITV